MVSNIADQRSLVHLFCSKEYNRSGRAPRLTSSSGSAGLGWLSKLRRQAIWMSTSSACAKRSTRQPGSRQQASCRTWN